MVSGLKGQGSKQLPYQPPRTPILDPRALLLFDIDGVIRDVGGSYRRAIVETVHHYSGWRPDPAAIDSLKGEGCWNNDWEASLELLRRRRQELPASLAGEPFALPELEALVAVFGGFYFGGDPEGDPAQWRGFIGAEPLLVDAAFFEQLEEAGIAWGFVSGAEPSSVRFVLERRLGLADPPAIAMGQAPDKPDPTGLLQLAERICRQRSGRGLGAGAPPVAYLGDTVADVQTVQRARRALPQQAFLSLAVAPPHLHAPQRQAQRQRYEAQLQEAGADRILACTTAVLAAMEELLAGG
jgi:HAD superfamily phosphatase